MKKFFRAISCRLTSTAVLAVIIGSLCFSAGEGLRLTPFTVSQLTQNAESFQYGPLDVRRSLRNAARLAQSGNLLPLLQPFAALYVLILATFAPLLAKESEWIHAFLTRIFKRRSRPAVDETEQLSEVDQV